MISRDEYFAIIKTHRDMEEALSVGVRITGGEVMRLVVQDLLAKRTACLDSDLIAHFDAVLRNYYLSEMELQVAINQAGGDNPNRSQPQ